MDIKPIPVITSKLASNDYNKIISAHSDIVQGITNQSQKVAQYKQQKEAEIANKAAMENELKQSQMVADTAAKKDALQFAQKQAELDIKRAALSAT